MRYDQRIDKIYCYFDNSKMFIKDVKQFLANNNTNINKAKIGRLIGSGAEGLVYNYGSGKVIKFTLDFYNGGHRRFKSVFKKLKENQSPLYAKVYDFGTFRMKGITIYYYIAEKLRCDEEELVEDWDDHRFNFLSKIGLPYTDDHNGNFGYDKYGNQKIIDLTAFCWTF